MKTQAKKKLTFSKNSVTELNSEKLTQIYGGDGTTTPSIYPTVNQNTSRLCKTVQSSY